VHLQAIEPWSVRQWPLRRSPMLLLLQQALLLFALLLRQVLLLLLLLLDLQLSLQVLLLLHVLHLRRHAEALGKGRVQTLCRTITNQSDQIVVEKSRGRRRSARMTHHGPHLCTVV